MKSHKTAAGHLVVGTGLILYCVVLGTEIDLGLTQVSSSSAFENEGDVSSTSVADTDVVRAHSMARVSPRFDVSGTVCGTCTGLDISHMPVAQGLNPSHSAFASADDETGMAPHAASPGNVATSAAPGSTAAPTGTPSGAPGWAAAPMWGQGRPLPSDATRGARPAVGDKPPALEPIVIALNDPDAPLEPALTGIDPGSVVPGSNGTGPTSLQPETSVPAAASVIDPPASPAAAPDRIDVPPHRGNDLFKVPSNDAVLPSGAPDVFAALPGSGRGPTSHDGSPTVAYAAPSDNSGGVAGTGRHDDPVRGDVPDLMNRLVAATSEGDIDNSVRNRDRGAPPAGGNNPVELLLNGPDRAFENIADAERSPGKKIDYPFIGPASEAATALTFIALAVAEVPEPSILALLALAALGLALTSGSRQHARLEPRRSAST